MVDDAGLATRFLGLIRFSHTIFALPFAALAAVLALVVPLDVDGRSVQTMSVRLLGVLVCMVAARSAAMAFNRLVDASLDARNPRTAGRHLPAGELTTGQVWLFFVGMSGLFLGGCAMFLPNWLPLALSLPVLGWICGYSFAKRFTASAHVWLGFALALSPICTWIALRGEQLMQDPLDGLPAAGLGIAIALWVTGFDIIYACQDADFDRQAGLHSIPAKYGIAGGLRIASWLHRGMLAVLAALPFAFPQLSWGLIYYGALGVVLVLVLRQHAIVSGGDLGRVNVAFFHINAWISLGLSGFAALDAWLR
jgi:4-hydroxybenzoate polyprenyltransferase